MDFMSKLKLVLTICFPTCVGKCRHKAKIREGGSPNAQYTAHVNRDEQGFDRYLAVQGWLDNIL